MPAIHPDSKVLLTGGTGFLGAWVLKGLLDEGFSVRAAVRSESKAEFLKSRFKEQENKLEFVYIDDITTPGVFDKASIGVDGVVHCASPLPDSDPDLDPEKLIRPAVDGTLSVLRSAIGSTTVKRVVITSSLGAVWAIIPKYTPVVYTENDWNEQAIEMLEEQGKHAAPFVKYCASKALAEKAAWNFMKENSPSFDLVTILPGFVWGKFLSETTAEIQGSNTSLLNILKLSSLATHTFDSMKTSLPAVDARDISKQHVQALLVPDAGGERFLSAAISISPQDAINYLNDDPIEGITLPQSESLGDWKPNGISNEKIQKILGATFRPIRETVHDTVVGALEVGWKQ